MSVTHYEVQKTRRARFMKDWRDGRKTGVIKAADVRLEATARGIKSGVYMGADGGKPTRTIDALVHEIEPGAVSTIHRHSWDAVLFVVEGRGWTEVDGVRHEWKPWDAIYLPSWSWHRHGHSGNDEKTARFISISSQPLIESLGVAMLQEGGDAAFADLQAMPAAATSVPGDNAYSRRLDRLAQQDRDRRATRIHTPYDEIELRPTPRGTRTAFLVDESIGYATSGLTAVMLQLAPGLSQTMHRHPGEAWLYVVEGHGHSYIDIEPKGGRDYAWGPGDLIIVDHFLWHQHFNDDPDSVARLVRVHMFASVLETMRALLDPLVLFEEPPEALAEAPDISSIEWPEDRRPS